jgi:hypothetical protein
LSALADSIATEKFSLAKWAYLANMGGQLGKEQAATLQGVFNNPGGAL